MEKLQFYHHQKRKSDIKFHIIAIYDVVGVVKKLQEGREQQDRRNKAF